MSRTGRRSAVALMAIAWLAFYACDTSTTSATGSSETSVVLAKGNGNGNGNGGGGNDDGPFGSEIPLSLTFDQSLVGLSGDGDADGDGWSDAYVHDVEEVLAVIAGDDNFSFQSSTARRSPTRLVNIAIDTPELGPSDLGLQDVRFQTKDLCPENQFAGCQPGEIDAALGAMPVGPDTLRVIMSVAWEMADSAHSLRYGLGCVDNVDRKPVQRGYVIHPDPDRWVVWGAQATWCARRVKGNSTLAPWSEDAAAGFTITLERTP